LNDLGVKGLSDFVFAVAHKSPFRAADSEEIRLPIPASFIGQPRNYYVGRWYYSEACLVGVTELQLCIDQNRPSHACIGILLKYNNGRTESLGQWRFDFAISTVKPTTYFYICTVLAENGSYVQYVGLDKRKRSESEEVWLRISVHDTLSCWFDSKRFELFVKPNILDIGPD
jgi:hypothetical protein